MQKYFHVSSNLRLIHSEYCQEKTLHVEGNKVPKANLKCTGSLSFSMMSRTNILTVRHLSLVSRVMLCSACGKRSV